MSPILTRRALVASLCFFPLAATAQTTTSPVQKLDDIVVTASRTPEALRDVVGDVTVIDQQELQAAGKDSLAEILSRQPGVQFTSQGGPQAITGIFMRGAESRHTLVLVDGVRMTDAITGGTQFPALDPAMVERIEILRGAASSLYGSDAIGGVINIITKKGEQDRPLSAWANIGYGSYETAKSSMGLSGAGGGWDYSLSTSAASSNGFDSTRRTTANNQPYFSHNRDRDGYRSHAVSGSLGYRWSEGHRIGLTAYNGYTDGDYDNGAAAANSVALYRQQAYAISSTDRFTDWWDSAVHINFSKDTNENRAATTSQNATLKREYSWQNTFTLQPDHRVSVLLDRLEERLQSTSEFDKTTRNTNAAALIYNGRIDRLHAQASIRNDNISGYGNQTTGSLGLDIDLSDAWQVGIAGNTGFRAPTFADLYQVIPGVYEGNPDLKPEKSKNIEAHIQYQSDTSNLKITAYQNKIHDLIAPYICKVHHPIFGYCTLGTPENINRATIRGLTLAGEHDFGNTTLRASADFMDPRNDNPAQGESEQLIRRARQVFRASAEHRIQALKLGAEYQYTSRRYDIAYDALNNREDITLGGFSLFNLTAAYDINKNLGVQVRWNNVLDKDYVLVDGYNTPGSNVFVNLSWRM